MVLVPGPRASGDNHAPARQSVPNCGTQACALWSLTQAQCLLELLEATHQPGETFGQICDIDTFHTFMDTKELHDKRVQYLMMCDALCKSGSS